MKGNATANETKWKANSDHASDHSSEFFGAVEGRFIRHMSLRSLILGTAGHIDHGKTSLVQALTGINCDRLPEEKSRGITIDIGFAHCDLGEVNYGIVDVPGHERFVRNMLAGATGIDVGMLVVAADDSVMPQTREHFEILNLLGIRLGLIVITKSDCVNPSALELVKMGIGELVSGTSWETAPIVVTSARTGDGIKELKTILSHISNSVPPRIVTPHFRMAIDRSFVMQGYGTIVTGTVYSGRVTVGDVLDWHTGDGRVESIRVRGLNRHGKSVLDIDAGQRAAINLPHVTVDAIGRGQELASPGYLVASRVVSVQLMTVSWIRRTLRHRMPCRVHIGTHDVSAVLSLLDCDRVESGHSAIAQIFLNTPVTCVWGQSFVIRDANAEHTIGGGRILQPNAVKLRRRHLDSMEKLEQLISNDDSVRLGAATWLSGETGLQWNELDRTAGIFRKTNEKLMTSSQTDSRSAFKVLFGKGGTERLIHPDRLVGIRTKVLSALSDLHADHPLCTTIEIPKILARLGRDPDDEVIASVFADLIKNGDLIRDGRGLARADFKPKLSKNQRKLKDRIVADHQSGDMSPPDLTSYLNQVSGNKLSLQEICDVAIAEGLLVRISSELFLAASTEIRIRQIVANGFLTRNSMTVSEIRDLLGTTRKYAIPICEYLDKIGFTVRRGDFRSRPINSGSAL